MRIELPIHKGRIGLMGANMRQISGYRNVDVVLVLGAMTVYAVLEITAIRIGLAVLPRSEQAWLLWIGGYLCGMIMESRIVRYAGPRNLAYTTTFLMYAYMLPIIAGTLGQIAGWLLWLSVAVFVILVTSVLWRSGAQAIRR